MVARLPWEQEVGGSIPPSPTIPPPRGLFSFGDDMHVTLHIINGDRLALPGLTRHQHERITRTLNQAVLPVTPFMTQVDGLTVEIPWRCIAYTSRKEET